MYELYGLAVESALALPCPRRKGRARADVRLRAGSAVQFARVRRQTADAGSPDWFHCRTLPDGTTYLQWTNLFEFLVSPDGRLIRYHRLPRGSDESFNTYLLSQVLSCSLLALGIEPLHATAVVIDGQAVAFLGDCGHGKSTLGAAFLARGCRLLTDDLLALEPRDTGWMAHPGPPRLKLFPLVAEQVLAGDHRGRLMNPATSKLVLRLSDAETSSRSVPLKALYVLGAPVKGRRPAKRAVTIDSLSGRRAFLEVIRAAFNLIQFDRRRLENQFAMATRLAAEVPLRRLTYPRKLSSLDAVCAAVLTDLSRP